MKGLQTANLVYGWNTMTRTTDVISLKRICLQLDKGKSQKHQNLQEGCACQVWHCILGQMSKVKVRRWINVLGRCSSHRFHGPHYKLHSLLWMYKTYC